MTDKKAGDGQEQLEKRPEQILVAPDAIEAVYTGGPKMQSLLEKHPNNWASEGKLFAIEDGNSNSRTPKQTL